MYVSEMSLIYIQIRISNKYEILSLFQKSKVTQTTYLDMKTLKTQFSSKNVLENGKAPIPNFHWSSGNYS